MSILKNLPMMAAADIRTRLNAYCGPNAKLSILAIGSPAMLLPNVTTTYNTAMLVEIDSAYHQWVLYNRVDAAGYFSVNAPNSGVILSKVVTGTHDALDDINKYLGTDFLPEEVVNNVNPFELTFTDQSRWFTGSYIVPSVGQVSADKLYIKMEFRISNMLML